MAGMEKLVLTFPKTNPDIRVEPVSTDPLNPDFTSFGIFDTDSGDNLCILRADDIVQQRNFMAALGAGALGCTPSQATSRMLRARILIRLMPRASWYEGKLATTHSPTTAVSAVQLMPMPWSICRESFIFLTLNSLSQPSDHNPLITSRCPFTTHPTPLLYFIEPNPVPFFLLTALLCFLPWSWATEPKSDSEPARWRSGIQRDTSTISSITN